MYTIKYPNNDNFEMECLTIEQAIQTAGTILQSDGLSRCLIVYGRDYMPVAFLYATDDPIEVRVYTHTATIGSFYPSHFFIADGDPLFPGFTALEKWNGFDVPYFDQATMISIIEYYAESWGYEITGVDIGDNGEIIVSLHGEQDDIFRPMVDGLYCLSGWVWNEWD